MLSFLCISLCHSVILASRAYSCHNPDYSIALVKVRNHAIEYSMLNKHCLLSCRMKSASSKLPYWDQYWLISCLFSACASCLGDYGFVNKCATHPYGAVGVVLMSLKIYNSTVTQMSACLLSLSVMSLLLPVRQANRKHHMNDGTFSY